MQEDFLYMTFLYNFNGTARARPHACMDRLQLDFDTVYFFVKSR